MKDIKVCRMCRYYVNGKCTLSGNMNAVSANEKEFIYDLFKY